MLPALGAFLARFAAGARSIGSMVGRGGSSLIKRRVRRSATDWLGKSIDRYRQRRSNFTDYDEEDGQDRRPFGLPSVQSLFKRLSVPKSIRTNPMFGHVGNALRGKVGAPPSTPAQSVELPKNFSSIAGKGSNFGDVLSGKKSATEAVGDAAAAQHAERVKADQEERHEADRKAIDSTKTFAKDILSASAKGALGIGFLGIASVKFAKSINESLQPFARFNGQLAHAHAELQHNRHLRDMATANTVAEEGSALADAVNSFESQIAPLKDLVTEKLATTGTALLMVITEGVSYLKQLPFIASAVERAEREAKQHRAAPWEAFIKESAGRARTRQNPPL